MEQRDYYKSLGVEKEATARQIKDAYRKLALKFHPDRNKDAAAALRMKEINEAYAVISDPQKRAQYDTLRQQYGSSAYSRFRQTYSEQDIFRGSDIEQVFEELSRAFGFRGFEEIFRESYGPGHRSFAFRRPGGFARGFMYYGSPGGGPGAQPRGLPGGGLGRLLRYVMKKKWGVELPERGKDRHDTITISPALAARGGGSVTSTD